MDKDTMKIITKDNEVISLKDLFERKKISRKIMAGLKFEDKIRVLIDLQKIAYSWGGRKNIIVWG